MRERKAIYTLFFNVSLLPELALFPSLPCKKVKATLQWISVAAAQTEDEMHAPLRGISIWIIQAPL